MHRLPETTRAVVWYGPNDLRLEELPLPPLGPRDVLIANVACGLCATDVHAVDGLIPFYTPPRVLGHEVAGRVVAVGEGVRGLASGQAVAVDTTLGCGACFYCQEGKRFTCPWRSAYASGMAQYQVAPDGVVYPLPAGLPIELGAFAEPLSCCLHAVEISELRAGESVAIVGAGAIGLLTLLAARLAGATTAVVADLDAARRELALRLGATLAVEPTRDDLRAAVREATGGLGADRVFEAVGAAATVEAAIPLARRGGTVTVIGVAPSDAEVRIRPYELFEREITLRFSYIRAFEFRRAVALLPHLDLAPLLTRHFPLERAAEALEAARRREGIKVQIRPG